MVEKPVYDFIYKWFGRTLPAPDAVVLLKSLTSSGVLAVEIGEVLPPGKPLIRGG
jgi:hypothetical protein